ncbi:MAG: transaldolase [Eubacterium sp.]|jgi:transaldolase|nr:transaldolase [Eubacterium sp.]
MSTFKGKLHETVVKFPNTDIWMDSCGENELNYALERGCVGATSNPAIVGSVVKGELAIWERRIKEMAAERKDMTEEDVAWGLIYEIGALRSKKLLPIFNESRGMKGRLSIQTNPKYYRDTEKMLQQADIINSLGPNMQVKMPASEAGVKAMEEATFKGISINATVSFTVAQAVAVAEAVERGLKRRAAEGLSTETMSPVCTIMIGRTDDWMKKYTDDQDIIVDPECLEWSGIAVMKEAYRIFKERGYRTRLLSAACRNHHHWSQLIGGDLSMTIPFNWHKKLNSCGVEVSNRIGEPVRNEYMRELGKISEFEKSFKEDGMKPSEFEKYGGFRTTVSGFIGGYDELLKLVRGYMI